MHERRLREWRAGVYVIECTVTGQFYVGSSSNLDERKAAHWALLRRGKHPNARLQEAWVLYGEGALTFRVVEIVDDLAGRREKERRHAEALEAASPGRSFCERLPAPGFDPEQGGERWSLPQWGAGSPSACGSYIRHESNASWVTPPQRGEQHEPDTRASYRRLHR